MKNTIKVVKAIAGITIFILALIFIQVKKQTKIYNRDSMLIRLPEFESFDISNNLVRSSFFKEKNLYVQFIDPLSKNDIELFKIVYSNWKDENLFFIAITKNYEELKLKLGMDLQKVVILNRGYKSLASLFNALRYGTVYLFDRSGSLIYAGGYDTKYDQTLKIILNQLIKDKYFFIENFIPEKRNIKNIDWLKQISEVVEKENKEYFVISLFTSICAGCTSGLIFQELKDFHSKNREFAYILCILSDRYNKDDILNLKSQLKVEFPVFLADKALSIKWNSFIQEYSETYLNNIMFITDKEGNIIKLLDPHCKKCWKPFFLFMSSLKPK
jgi:hypothetical protein